jgi:DNA-binding MarR family transcriptional regulator
MIKTVNSSPTLNISETEIHKMHALISIIDRIADELLNNSQEISYSQFIILFMLDRHSQLSQKELSKCLGLTEAAVSKQIENMFVKNFLFREVDPENRRRNNITLTDFGKKIFLSANQLLIQKAEEIFMVLNNNEREVFNSVLDKLLNQTMSICNIKTTKN